MTDTTTTTHRTGCTRPGWTFDNSRTLRGVVIARCQGCQAVELRKAADR